MVLKFKAGDKVLSDKAYAAAINSPVISQYCSYCYRYVTTTPCESCQFVSYCSGKCRRKDHKIHKVECEAIQLSPDEKPDYEVRLVIRVLTRHLREVKAGRISVGKFFGYKRKITDLVSHIEDLYEDKARYQSAYTKASGIHALIKHRLSVSELDVLTMMQRMRINTFGASSPTGSPSMIVVHLAASKFNHTCENAIDTIAHLFDGRRLIFRAMQNFQVSDPLDLKISYLQPLMSYKERQKCLKTTYFFKCKCPRCEREAELDDEDSLDPTIASAIDTLIKADLPFAELYEHGVTLADEVEDVPDTNMRVHQLYSALQSAAYELSENEKSIEYGLRALGGCEAMIYKANILYLLFCALCALGVTTRDSPSYQTYVDCVRLGKGIMEKCYGKKYQCTKEFRKAAKEIGV